MSGHEDRFDQAMPAKAKKFQKERGSFGIRVLLAFLLVSVLAILLGYFVSLLLAVYLGVPLLCLVLVIALLGYAYPLTSTPLAMASDNIAPPLACAVFTPAEKFFKTGLVEDAEVGKSQFTARYTQKTGTEAHPTKVTVEESPPKQPAQRLEEESKTMYLAMDSPLTSAGTALRKGEKTDDRRVDAHDSVLKPATALREEPFSLGELSSQDPREANAVHVVKPQQEAVTSDNVIERMDPASANVSPQLPVTPSHTVSPELSWLDTEAMFLTPKKKTQPVSKNALATVSPRNSTDVRHVASDAEPEDFSTVTWHFDKRDPRCPSQQSPKQVAREGTANVQAPSLTISPSAPASPASLLLPVQSSVTPVKCSTSHVSIRKQLRVFTLKGGRRKKRQRLPVPLPSPFSGYECQRHCLDNGHLTPPSKRVSELLPIKLRARHQSHREDKRDKTTPYFSL